MKFSLIFLAILVASAVAADPEGGVRSENGGIRSEDGGIRGEDGGIRGEEGGIRGEDGGIRSEEGILGFGKNFGKLALKGLKELAKTVGKDLIGKATEILTDGLHLKPTKEAQEALNAGPSTEGIFNATGELILKRAGELAAAHAAAQGPSHEGILADLGSFYKIYEAEQNLYYQYNHTFHGDGVSHEGILGGLGGFALHGLGDLIGGQIGGIFNGAGNILGNIFLAYPGQESAESQEGIISQLGGGILTNAGKLVVNGAAKAAKSVIKGLFSPIGDLLKGALWLYRGNYNGSPDLMTPGKEAILQARAQIHQHPEAEECIEAAERNLTHLHDLYMKNGQECADEVHPHGKEIVAHVFDIVLDAVKRVEDAHREAGYCFDKEVMANKIVCLDEEVPAQIEEHRQKFLHYGRDLAGYVRKFSDINTQFDVCLTKHVGDLRRDVYHIVYDFHSCVDAHKSSSKRKHV